VIFDAALAISRRSSDVSATAVTPGFSVRRACFRVPEMGTIPAPAPGGQASAIRARVAGKGASAAPTNSSFGGARAARYELQLRRAKQAFAGG